MFRIAVLALFVLSCSCQQVIEVSGQKVVNRNVPLRVSSGVSVPVGQTLVSGVSSPVVSSYSVGGLHSAHNNLAYLQDLRARVLGTPSFYGSAIGSIGGLNSVNIAPSVLSSYPFGQSYQAISRPQHAIAYAQPSYAIAHQPAYAVAHHQPAYAVAHHQPAYAVAHHQPALAVHQGSIAVARPQVYSANAQTAVHPVNAAITQVARTVEYRPIPYQDQPIVPQEIVVEPSDQPINIHFRSRSSTVRISQEHIPGEPGEVQQTQSQDDASRVQHEVVKPVVQEVKEVIQPYRQVTQEINPVVENVHTVVTHGEGQRAHYVAEPVVRQQLLSVRPAVQHLAVAAPAVHQIAVPRVQSVAVAQPVYQHYQQVRPVSVVDSQPIQAVGHVQTLAVPRAQYAVSQPLVSSYVAQPAVGVLGVRSVGVAQPVVGVNRVVAYNQPGAVLRSEVREVRPGQTFVQESRGQDFFRHRESDN